MQGVTTAIVAFIFAGVIWPHLVKHKVQFYAVLLAVVLIILLDGIGYAFGAQKPIYAVIALLQIAALVLAVLSTGMSAKDLGGEVFHTIDVVRRGGERETIIVPLTGERPKPRNRDMAAEMDAARQTERDIAAEEAELDAQEAVRPAPAVTPPPARKPEGDAPIPLE
jgi:hypothetical protein